MTDILMPKLSDSMEQGTILSWLKSSGDEVEIGDDLLEIETDKSTVPYVAEAAGTLEILTEEGTTVAVGEVIARVGAASSEGSLGSAVELEIAAEPVAANSNGVPADKRARQEDQPPHHSSLATPVARRVAAAHGLSLRDIKGTGPLGRITRADVLKRAGGEDDGSALPSLRSPSPALDDGHDQAPASVPKPESAAPKGAQAAVTHRQPSRLQAVIARRMAQSKATIPHFQVQTEVDMGAALALRAELKRVAGEDPAPTINDFIIKAAALALHDHPLANASYLHDTFVLHDAVNVGVAVAAEEALVVPTIFDADIRSLGEIGREARRLASAVRDGTIAPSDLEGGTFTVSNLGMFGMTAITPIINPRQAAILGVGATRQTLTRLNGEIADQTLLTLTLSCDHRILYGADAARFLARIRKLLEAPLKLAL